MNWFTLDHSEPLFSIQLKLAKSQDIATQTVKNEIFNKSILVICIKGMCTLLIAEKDSNVNDTGLWCIQLHIS